MACSGLGKMLKKAMLSAEDEEVKGGDGYKSLSSLAMYGDSGGLLYPNFL